MLLTRVRTKDVQYRLHKTENVFTTRTHFGQKEHQTDTSSELRAEGSTYHVWSRSVKVSASDGTSEKNTAFQIRGHSRRIQ